MSCNIKQTPDGTFKITTYANGDRFQGRTRYDSLSDAEAAITLWADQLKEPPKGKPKKEKRGLTATNYLGHAMVQYPNQAFSIIGPIVKKSYGDAPMIYNIREAKRYIREKAR